MESISELRNDRSTRILFRSVLCATLWICFSVCLAESVENPEPPTNHRFFRNIEFGLKTWLSSGQTDWNHTVGSFDPLLGDPTSEITYKQTEALVFDFFGRVHLPKRFVLKGNLALGNVTDGSVIDDDYYSREYADFLGISTTRYLRTESVIDGDGMNYQIFDLGNEFLNLGELGTVGAFIGFQRWQEKYLGKGVVILEFPQNLDRVGEQRFPPNQTIFINYVRWNFRRFGVLTTWKIGPRILIQAEGAWIPDATFHNEDTHILRGDLGGSPNIIMDGKGKGYQMEVEINVRLYKQWTATFGYRNWSLQGDGRVLFRAQEPDPWDFRLNDFDTERHGILFALGGRF